MSDKITILDGHAEPPPLTGTRHWYDLSGAEQDRFLLSCFKGATEWQAVEVQLDLFDRIAGSIANAILGVSEGWKPADEQAALAMQVRRTLALKNTLLGQRLLRAIGRAEATAKSDLSPAAFDYTHDPMLFFDYLDLAKTRGFEMLSEACLEDISLAAARDAEEWRSLPKHEKKGVEADVARLFESAAGDSRTDLSHAAQQHAAPARTTDKDERPGRSQKQVDAQPTLGSLWILILVDIALLAWALQPDNPYGFYVLLRWLCCGSFAWFTYAASLRKLSVWPVVLGAAAVVYNPLLPLHLGRDIWELVNLVTILLLAAFAVRLWRDRRKE